LNAATFYAADFDQFAVCCPEVWGTAVSGQQQFVAGSYLNLIALLS
jgi:hypothetical protein